MSRVVTRIGVVVALMVWAASGSAAEGEAQVRVVEIHAKRFEFTPREVTLKRGEPVKLRLTSEDVTHGFFQRALKIDAEIVPGKVTEIAITPEKAGRYTTICDHFCGSGHGNMKMTIVVE